MKSPLNKTSFDSMLLAVCPAAFAATAACAFFFPSSTFFAFEYRCPFPPVVHPSLHNLVASALFVVLHISLRDLQSGLLVLLPSIVLGLLRDRGVSLMKLIGIHGLWNLGWFSIYSPT